jgi:hypothetical protein
VDAADRTYKQRRNRHNREVRDRKLKEAGKPRRQSEGSKKNKAAKKAAKRAAARADAFGYVPPANFESRYGQPQLVTFEKNLHTSLQVAVGASQGYSGMGYDKPALLADFVHAEFDHNQEFPEIVGKLYSADELIDTYGFRRVPWDGVCVQRSS